MIESNSTNNVSRKTVSQLNMDEEIAFALFNATVPQKYVNNPHEFENYLSKINGLKKKTTTQEKKFSLWLFLKNINRKNRRPKIESLVTPLIEHHGN